MTNFTPTAIRESLNFKRAANRSSEKVIVRPSQAIACIRQGGGFEFDTASQSDSSSGKDTDSACYSMESLDLLSSSPSSKPIMLQLTLDNHQNPLKPKDTAAPKADNKAEVTEKGIAALKTSSKVEAAITKATTVPNAVSKIEATTQATTVTRRVSKTEATAQATTVPNAVSKIEATNQATDIHNTDSETEVATQAAESSGSSATNAHPKKGWARFCRRLKGSAELEKEKEEAAAAKASASQELPVKTQDNNATNEDKKETSTESQGNGAIDNDKKAAIPESQGNGATDQTNESLLGESQHNGTTDKSKDEKPLPIILQDMNKIDKGKGKEPPPIGFQAIIDIDKSKGKKPLPVVLQDTNTIGKGEKPFIDSDTNIISEYKKSMGPNDKQAASKYAETTIVTKNENATPHPGAYSSAALAPESPGPVTSQTSVSSYYTALSGNEGESSTSARPPTPDLISFFPIVPPRSSSTGALVITDATNNPIDSPKLQASSSLKVLHSNNPSTIEDIPSNEPQLYIDQSQRTRRTLEQHKDYIAKYLPDYPMMEPIRSLELPTLKEVVERNSKPAHIIKELKNEREKLLELKRACRRKLEDHTDRMSNLRRCFMTARTRLDEMYDEHRSYGGNVPEDWKEREQDFKSRYYLYGQRAYQVTEGLKNIYFNSEYINSSLMEVDREMFIMEILNRKKYPYEKTGCLACFKKIGRLFKSKKSKD